MFINISREPQKKKKEKETENEQSLKLYKINMVSRKYYWRGFNLSEKIADYNRKQSRKERG